FFARRVYRRASVRLLSWRVCAGSDAARRKSAREEEQSERRFLRRGAGHRPGQIDDFHAQTPPAESGTAQSCRLKRSERREAGKAAREWRRDRRLAGARSADRLGASRPGDYRILTYEIEKSSA